MARQESDSVQLKLRTKEPLRARLERSARERGVSMNSEIEDRLSRSFDTVDETFGSRETLGLLRIVAAAMNEVGMHAGFTVTHSIEGAQRWFDNPWAYDQAIKAAGRVFEALRPEGDITLPAVPGHLRLAGQRVALAKVFQNLGSGFAAMVLEEVGTGKAVTARNAKRTDQIRRDLGRMTNRISKGGKQK